MNGGLNCGDGTTGRDGGGSYWAGFTKADFNVLVYMYYIPQLVEINLNSFLLLLSLILDDVFFVVVEGSVF